MTVANGPPVELRILGPLEVAVGSRRIALSGTRQQIVLATLLLNANRVVSLDRLLEAIYGDRPPATSRAQAQITISSLRHLFAVQCCAMTISTQAQGYVINLGPGQLDAQRFEELVAAAREDRDANHLERAAAHYRDALRLWRGPALAGIDSQLVQLSASWLDEQRISVTEDRVGLELDLCRHHELVSELIELVEGFPLRERLREQLMLALYRSGRAAEALQAYRQARQTMIDELGIEPNERLRQLEHAILTSDPSLEAPAEPVKIQPVKRLTPCLLPTDIADFTGRAKQNEQIFRHLVSAAEDENRLAVPIVVIEGKGGIGKTCSAVHACHGIAERFPDGQLFANLHGNPHPASSTQVLERFLRALGVPGSQIPDSPEERAEAYRGLLAGRRVLVLLDDAGNESQVAPLLPGNPTSAVVVTSRSRLAGLAGAVHIELDVFDPGMSLELLARIAGTERLQFQPEAAAQIADLCGHLPLALRIAGARLSARPHWSIQQLVDRLADETRRLDELRYGDMGIRANISLSYEGASEEARRLFRRLVILGLPVFSGWVSAPLLDRPLTDAEDVLDDLVNARLIEATGIGSGVRSQYRFHELIRVFARERLAAEESAADRTAALERALGALFDLSEEAHRRQYGGDYVRLSSQATRWPLPGRLAEQLMADPLAWYEGERTALVSGVRQAAQAGLVELCWSLALSAVTLFESRIYLGDWRETHEIALEATRQARHARGQAAVLYSIGSLSIIEQKYGQARQELTTAAQLFREVGDDQGTALVTRHLAFLDRLGGHLDDAAGKYRQALGIFRRTGDQVATAYVLHSLARVELERGDLCQAGKLLSEALELSRAAQSRRVEAQVLHRIGEAHLLAGEPSTAATVFGQALAIVRDIGDPIGEAYTLQGVGLASVRRGEFASARGALERAVTLARKAGEHLAEARALLGLSELALSTGDPGQAVASGRMALGIFRIAGVPLQEAQALTVLSDAYALLGDDDASAEASAAALALRAASQA